MLNDLINLLNKLGNTVVENSSPNQEYGRSYGFLVVKGNNDNFFRVDYNVDSYGNEMTFEGLREVKPKEVTKVEYI